MGLVLQQKPLSDGGVSLCPTPWTEALRAHQSVLTACFVLDEPIQRAIGILKDTLTRGGKILLCGNGGSAAHAQHMAAELVVRYESRDRKALSAIALTTDTSVLTAAGNDLSYREIFRRQVEALAEPEDTLIAISTSGKSGNVYAACHRAASIGCHVIALTGSAGLYDFYPDVEIRVPSVNTARIQEVHTIMIHAMCQALEG